MESKVISILRHCYRPSDLKDVSKCLRIIIILLAVFIVAFTCLYAESSREIRKQRRTIKKIEQHYQKVFSGGCVVEGSMEHGEEIKNHMEGSI